MSFLGILSMDAQQFRFPSLAPRVEHGLPWSLPRPFCLSPGFSLPVDPYRTGEFRLTASVASRYSLAAVLHTLCLERCPKGCTNYRIYFSFPGRRREVAVFFF